jgi:hypothetical protein
MSSTTQSVGFAVSGSGLCMTVMIVASIGEDGVRAGY